MTTETKKLFKITQACLENINLAINERLNSAASPLELEQLNKLKAEIKKSKVVTDEILKGP